MDSIVAPPAGFRRRVYERTGPRCVVCQRTSGLPEHTQGQFDPAHLIPAQMIRREAVRTVALADYVYRAEVAVWCCRACHFTEDHSPARVVTRELLTMRRDAWGSRLWPQLVALAAEMDRHFGGGTAPFTAYVEARYP